MAVHTCCLTHRDAPEELHPETAWGEEHWILFAWISLPEALGLATATSVWRKVAAAGSLKGPHSPPRPPRFP